MVWVVLDGDGLVEAKVGLSVDVRLKNASVEDDVLTDSLLGWRLYAIVALQGSVVSWVLRERADGSLLGLV